MKTVLAVVAFSCGLVSLLAAFIAAKDGRLWLPGSRIVAVDRVRLWSVGVGLMAIGAVGMGIEALNDGAGPNLLPFSSFFVGIVITTSAGIHSRPWRKRPKV